MQAKYGSFCKRIMKPAKCGMTLSTRGFRKTRSRYIFYKTKPMKRKREVCYTLYLTSDNQIL